MDILIFSDHRTGPWSATICPSVATHFWALALALLFESCTWRWPIANRQCLTSPELTRLLKKIGLIPTCKRLMDYTFSILFICARMKTWISKHTDLRVHASCGTEFKNMTVWHLNLRLPPCLEPWTFDGIISDITWCWKEGCRTKHCWIEVSSL